MKATDSSRAPSSGVMLPNVHEHALVDKATCKRKKARVVKTAQPHPQNQKEQKRSTSPPHPPLPACNTISIHDNTCLPKQVEHHKKQKINFHFSPCFVSHMPFLIVRFDFGVLLSLSAFAACLTDIKKGLQGSSIRTAAAAAAVVVGAVVCFLRYRGLLLKSRSLVPLALSLSLTMVCHTLVSFGVSTPSFPPSYAHGDSLLLFDSLPFSFSLSFRFGNRTQGPGMVVELACAKGLFLFLFLSLSLVLFFSSHDTPRP